MIAWLRALALAGGAAAFAAALAPRTAVIAAALAAGLGARAAGALRARRVWPALAWAVLLSVLGNALASALSSDPRLALRLGPQAALQCLEVLRWLALAGPLAFALRALARRSALASAIELALAAAALALPLAAHRGGQTHRPLALGDWTSERAIDPALPFLAIGALAALGLAPLLLGDARRARVLAPLGAIALIAGGAALHARRAGTAPPAALRALGLAGESGEADGSPALDDLSADADRAPVAIALLHDDLRPPTGVYYFRQAALSQWNGRRLVRATRADVDLDVFEAFPAGAPLPARTAPPGAGRRSLETTIGLLVEHLQPFALDAPLEIAAAPNPAPERFARAYRVRASAPERARTEHRGEAPGDPAWSSEQRRHYTHAPGDPRYGELARRIVSDLNQADARDPLARALAIEAWLGRNATYTRSAERAGDGDPLESFLFGERSGHCVHFAHAAALLLRSLGLPARVALGYALPENARAGGSALLIRGADAHAWAELYLSGAGWVPIDPSPRTALDALAPPPDLELQRRLGELLRRPPAPAVRLTTPVGVERIGTAAGAVLAGLWLAGVALGIWRRLAARFARPHALPRTAYRAALDRLTEMGLVRRRGETRERFAARAAELAPSFGALTALHLRAALGGGLPADAREPFRLYTEVRRELRERAPLWRRALALVDPLAGWRAH